MATVLQKQEHAERRNKLAVERLRISRVMYMDMIEAGVIREGSRVQLIDGELFQMPAMGNAHWLAVGLLLKRLGKVLPDEWSFNCQSPIVTDEYGEPEPDIAIFRGPLESMTGKATAAQTPLVIEVADSTLAFDRRRKLAAYAEAKIAEYWIINLVDRVIEVRTEPRAREGEQRGRYAVLHEYSGDERVILRLDGQEITSFSMNDFPGENTVR